MSRPMSALNVAAAAWRGCDPALTSAMLQQYDSAAREEERSVRAHASTARREATAGRPRNVKAAIERAAAAKARARACRAVLALLRAAGGVS